MAAPLYETFINACSDDGLDRIIALVEAGAPLDCTSDEADLSDSGTPLLAAICAGRPDVVRYLLSAGADPMYSVDFWTPIHTAARKNMVGCLKALMDHGVDPNAGLESDTFRTSFDEPEKKTTPLWVAASEGAAEAVEALLKAGVTCINTLGPAGKPPVMAAAVCATTSQMVGARRCVELLVEHGANVAGPPGAALLRTLIEATMLLVNTPLLGPPPTGNLVFHSRFYTPVTDDESVDPCDIANGTAALLEWLIHRGAPTDSGSPFKPRARASWFDRPLACLGLPSGERSHTGGVAGTHSRYVRCMLEATSPARANVPVYAVGFAILAGHTGCLDLFLDHGASVNEAVDQQGRMYTPLFLAVSKGDADTVSLLLGHGADVSLPSGEDGELPLHALAYAPCPPALETPGAGSDGGQGVDRCLTLLLEAGADLGGRDLNGLLPLHTAMARSRNIGLWKRLMASGFEMCPVAERRPKQNSFTACVWSENTEFLRTIIEMGVSFPLQSRWELDPNGASGAGAPLEWVDSIDLKDTLMYSAVKYGRSRCLRMLFASNSLQANTVDLCKFSYLFWGFAVGEFQFVTKTPKEADDVLKTLYLLGADPKYAHSEDEPDMLSDSDGGLPPAHAWLFEFTKQGQRAKNIRARVEKIRMVEFDGPRMLGIIARRGRVSYGTEQDARDALGLFSSVPEDIILHIVWWWSPGQPTHEMRGIEAAIMTKTAEEQSP